MRIVSYRRDGVERFGIVDGDVVLDAGDDIGGFVPGAVVGPLDALTLLAPIPRPGKVVCVGRTASRVSRARALDVVLGYACGDDVSVRDL